MAEIKSLKEYWIAYLENVIPKDASINQVIESRRCFYAGAAAIMNTVMEIGNNANIDENIGAEIMDAQLEEIEEFFIDMENNRA